MKTVRYKTVWPWGTEVLYIFDDGLGTIAVGFESKYDFGYINNLVVHPTARKQGRGSFLLRKAEDEIRENFNRKYAVVRVVEGSWMEKWYRRCGYDNYEENPAHVNGYIELRKKLCETL